MALVDPTSGAGYAFGERLSAADMTTLVNQQPYALDTRAGQMGLHGGARSVTRMLTEPSYDAAQWSRTGAGMLTSAGLQSMLYWAFRAPLGSTLVSVAIYVDPGAHGAAWPPGTPVLTASRVSASGISSLGGASDPLISSQVDYELPHTITLVCSGSNVITDASQQLFGVSFMSETVADWQPMDVYLPTVTLTIPALDEL